MLFRFLLILSLFLIRPASACAGLKIEGAVTVKEHRLVQLKATGYDPGSAFDWSIDKDGLVDVIEKGDELYFAGPPGEYVVTCSALKIVGMGIVKTKCRVRVTIEAAGPKPPDKGKAPPVGKMSKEEAERALVYINFGSSGCTATVIGPKRADGRWNIFTANHCLGSGLKKGRAKLQDGRVVNVSVVWADYASDGAWLVTDSAVDDMPFAYLSKDAPPPGTAVWQAGYGVNTKRQTRTGEIRSGPRKDGKLTMKLAVSSGDSGGGIFRADTNEVVASVFGTEGWAGQVITVGCSCVKAWANAPPW